jgi:hypothetical protein
LIDVLRAVEPEARLDVAWSSTFTLTVPVADVEPKAVGADTVNVPCRLATTVVPVNVRPDLPARSTACPAESEAQAATGKV